MTFDWSTLENAKKALKELKPDKKRGLGGRSIKRRIIEAMFDDIESANKIGVTYKAIALLLTETTGVNFSHSDIRNHLSSIRKEKKETTSHESN